MSKSPLLPRVARGDGLAVRELVSRYERLIWSLVRRYSIDATDAEDAVQDIFLSLWQSAARFDESRASEPVFVTVIARRRLIERTRGRSRQPRTEELDETMPSAEPSTLDRGVEASRAVEALASLPDDQRRVLTLATRDGMTQEEIAQHTGLPLGTVKTNVRRALIRVRAIFMGETPDVEERP